MLIDTHAHIEGPEFDEDREEVLERARQRGVVTVINMGDAMDTSAKSFQTAKAYEMVYTGVGIHPERADTMKKGDLEQLADWAMDPKVLAIGEIGLDYHWEKDSERRELQKRVFIAQLDLARQLHLPVCVHDREAHGDTLAILKSEGKGIPGVLHCYSGSYETACEFLKLGWYLGVDGPLTFKNAERLPEMIVRLPLERILVETDCPYLAPVPMRGKRNEPSFVYYIAEKAAELRGESLAEFAAATTQNAHQLYGF